MRSRPAIRTASGIDALKCLLCGCCLEVCPNFDPNSEFAGAVLPVNAYRILNEEQDIAHQTELANAYRQLYFEGCGKSLACQDICPARNPGRRTDVTFQCRSGLEAIKCKGYAVYSRIPFYA
ncbi:MAG: 4Fe-4S dicluster domain-containing protein [Faecalibacterium sp.]